MALRLEFGDYELDEARYELKRRGELVDVQPKVLELIVYLAHHRERVVTKEELFNTVWDGTAVTESSLSQAVRSARTALGDSASEQHSIRTSRGRGLRFVAEVQERAKTPVAQAASSAERPVELGSTGVDTLEDASASELEQESVPVLIAILHAAWPHAGGACWSLDGIDEVELGRGSERKAVRAANERTLSVALPDPRCSRRHARVTRVPRGWLVIDEGSRNGTRVDGRRVHDAELAVGQAFECGSTTLMLARAPRDFARGRDALDAGSADLLCTVIPELMARERELGRVASSDVPVLITGESGVGKSHLAHALHAASQRERLGVVQVVQVPSEGASEHLAKVVDRARGGTLVLEGLDSVTTSLAAVLAAALDDDVRIIATAQAPFEAMAERIPRDLLGRVAAYRAHLPPLRERQADIGMLSRQWLEPTTTFRVEAMRALFSYGFPGNVRELELALRAAAIAADGSPVGLSHLPPEIGAHADPVIG